MQLVAYGAQDIYLTGNPQITFFKVVYRRHTNFSMEAIKQTWSGSTGVSGNPSAGSCSATISRNGDLIHRMYLELNGTLANSVHNFNSKSIKSIELEIGGQKIDKHTGDWMNVWSLLTEPNQTGMTGNVGTNRGTAFQNMSGMGGAYTGSSGVFADHLSFVPLMFWFCRNPGLSLPLIALQYHEVKVILEHDFSSNYSLLQQNDLYVDYIYLDTDERRRFAQVSHEYLIEQLQENVVSGNNQLLTFNHPVKELIFTSDQIHLDAIGNGNADNTIKLKLNGHDRFSARDYRYFTRTQIWQNHTGSGGIGGTVTNNGDSAKFVDSIGVYSFALKPEEHQPSGTCNFSRIDNAQLVYGINVNHLKKVYAVNYNVLRIMSGMGGLAYSN